MTSLEIVNMLYNLNVNIKAGNAQWQDLTDLLADNLNLFAMVNDDHLVN